MKQLNYQWMSDRYQIQTLLSRKRGRRTFLATDQQTNSSVVIKIVLFGPDSSWEDYKLFEREGKTLQSLNHPSIPQYLDSFEVDNQWGRGFALVQNYIKAQSLQEWIEAGRNFSEAELKDIAAQLLEILNYLHTRQPPVVHRDIKPSNILLGDRSGNSPGQLYLVDFGSVQTTISDGTITIVGTYGYMPPEQFSGETIAASDLYSLGATLVYLITGTHPAELPQHNGCIRLETNSITPEFQTWIKYLIQPNLDRRCQSAKQALEALQSDQFILPFVSIPSKPNGSRVRVIKTNERLQIDIPSLSLRQKLQVIVAAIKKSLIPCSLLLLGLIQFKIALVVAPLVFYWVSAIWIVHIYRLFEQTRWFIDQRKICITSHWLGFKRTYTASVQDITKLEHMQYRIYNLDNTIQQAPYSGLYLWIGNKFYSLETLGTAFKNVRRLTEVELDWLAFELSDWLDLPIHPSAETATDAVDSNSNSQEPTSGEDLSINSITPYQLPKIHRPANALCTVNQTAEKIEVVAPAGWHFLLLWFGLLMISVFISIFISISVAVNTTINPGVVIFLGIIPCIFWHVGFSSNLRTITNKIVLRIDRYEVSIWRQSQSPEWLCIKKMNRSMIRKLKLVYKIGSKYQKYCHVQISPEDDGSTPNDNFIVGNRKFWLTRREAEWLAYELSNWLQLPVTEVEVVESSGM